ncbi:hypothetical protein [uncultured Methanolobus sp.]|uniref:hypothetical protein n=1 Tax=uncultured Methanolobus sp. TaxID=218300 RepID=UPI0029C906D6|nr:hypothetical protein [uncultured Methanolobus sp.]
MSNNDGLYLGAALLGLGGVYLLSQSDSDISGGGLGETIREQIESIVAVPQYFTETIEKVSDFDLSGLVPDFEWPDFKLPTNEEINTAAGNAGTTVGAGIGGALGSAFLNGFTGLYKGAMVAGAGFVGRDDVNTANVLSEFSESLNSLKNTSLNSVYTGVPTLAGGLAKGLLFGGNAGDAARYFSGSKNTPTNTATNKGVINSVLSSQKRSSRSGSDGSARIAAFKANTRTSSAVMNTAGINKVTRTLKKAAGVA